MAVKDKSHVLINNQGTDILDNVGVGRNVAFQRMMSKMVGGNPLSDESNREEKEAEKQRKIQNVSAMLWLLAIRDNALSFEDSYGGILSCDLLEKKGVLTENDVQMANTADDKVADMRVIRISGLGAGGQDLFLVGDKRDEFLKRESCTAESQCTDTTMRDLQRSMIHGQLQRVDYSGSATLAPDLVRRMQRDPKIADYVAIAQREAEAAGIDGNMYANQLWQESRFNPNARSPAGARGISQMMPFQKGKFGLDSEQDFYDPEKSIRAGARMMSGLTDKYGDQRMALIAYNGGGGAIKFVEKSLGKDSVSFTEWHQFMQDRHERLGNATPGAWHNETRNYIEKIALAGQDITTAETSGIRTASASRNGPNLKAPSLELS